MTNPILNDLKCLRVFLTDVIDRLNSADCMFDDDWPVYTSHIALLNQLIDGARRPHDALTDPPVTIDADTLQKVFDISKIPTAEPDPK